MGASAFLRNVALDGVCFLGVYNIQKVLVETFETLLLIRLRRLQ
jgi:hypothetical protein